MERELLFSVTKKNFRIDWFSGTGAGGQKRNRKKNCCRLTHKESGVTTTGQEERSQKANLRNAFKRMIKNKQFKLWLKRKVGNYLLDKAELDTEISKKVDEMMRDENLKIEYL